MVRKIRLFASRDLPTLEQDVNDLLECSNVELIDYQFTGTVHGWAVSVLYNYVEE